ncbi:hypothetical protein CMEL01_08940 [Colletotrichum melonis]|uniref:Heterokaryon incompatibility domain-containing protein n=1 Tax=Colletotrichum melonis TaxID=1209925 RepID=A0AAI9TWE1_9PEZI|nr:hypothetical protein CMEL01_08940 [Colletotrichum melonis]
MRLSIYAVLYGGPMLEDIETGEVVNPPELEDFGDLEDNLRWLTEARLLCDPDDEFGNLLPNYAQRLIHQLPGFDDLPHTCDIRPRSQASDIEVLVAEANEALKFLRVDPDGSRQRISLHLDEGYTFDDRIYAVVHAECLDIAERVFASSTLSHVRDLRGLWTTLRWRQSITSKCSGSSGYFLQANHTLSRNDYYVPQSTVAGEPTWEEEDFSGLDWPGPYPSTLSNLYYTLTSSPLEIEELTNCLLQNLRVCRSNVTRTKKDTMLTDNLSKLPTEILDNIIAAMGRDMPPESSHQLPQRLWKDQLKVGSRGLLPWLWDIDPACVDAKDSEPCPGGVYVFITPPYSANMFTHAPLNESRREIRLVRIRPPPNEQVSAKKTIALEIKHASLDEPGLSYAALSYVWGIATDTTSIEIEGASFSVTSNLHAALQQLQINSVDSWLWIDALCIEQANLEEKNWQIGTMRDIFSGADMVYVWLGPGTENSDLAMDFISRTGTTLNKYDAVDLRSKFRDNQEVKLYIRERFSPQGEAINPSESMTTVEEAYRTIEYSTPQEKSEIEERECLTRIKLAVYDIFCDFFGHRSRRISEAIRDLLDREYWQRIWIIQEVVLARSASVVVAGNRSVLLDIFDAALRILWDHRGAVHLDHPSWTRFTLPISGALRGLKSLGVRYQRRRGVRVRLENILWELTVAPERPHYSATDPRDILFGLLGILEENEKQSSRVDYSLSKEDVFVNITTTILDSPGGGSSRFRLDSTVPGDRNGTLPTWVPDWQVIGQYGVSTWPISYSHEFEAAAQRKQRRKASDCLVIQDGRTSILQEGCYVDKVTEVMAPPVWEQVDVYTAPTLKRPDDWFLSVIEFAGLGPEPDPEEDHIWRILRRADYRKIKDNHRYTITAEVTDLWRRIMRVQALDAATLTTEETVFIIADTRSRNPSRSHEYINVTDEDLSRFAQDARRYLGAINRNRTLFKTAKGRVGLGHVGVEVDDVVTLIWGASCPIVLKERSEGHFYFGGDAYLDGMMFGEFLETELAEVEFRIF